MTSPQMRKIALPPEAYFGPWSGLGALDYGAWGTGRPLAEAELRLPIGLPAPYLWELRFCARHRPLTLWLTPPGEAPRRLDLAPGLVTESLGIAPDSGQDRPIGALVFGLAVALDGQPQGADQDAAQGVVGATAAGATAEPADDGALLGEVLFLGMTCLPLAPDLFAAKRGVA